MSRRKQGCVARRYLRRLRATGKREFSAGNVPRSTAAANLTEVLPKFVTRLMGFWVQRKPWPLITDEPRFSQGMLERKPPNKLPDPLRTFSAGSSAAGPQRNHLFAVKRFGGHRDTGVLRPCPLPARRLSHPGLWMCDIQAPMYRAGGNLWKDGDSLPLSSCSSLFFRWNVSSTSKLIDQTASKTTACFACDAAMTARFWQPFVLNWAVLVSVVCQCFLSDTAIIPTFLHSGSRERIQVWWIC